MKETIDHTIEPSVYLWLDNLIIEKNLGFQNYSGQFKPATAIVDGLKGFAAPHRQFVYDFSVSGAIPLTGVKVGATTVPTGANLKIDLYHGEAMFTTQPNGNVSSAYSFKEVNVYFTTSSEQEVLFDNKFLLNPYYAPNADSFDPTRLVYPCIFIKASAGENTTVSLDSLVATNFSVRLVVMASSVFQYRALTSILRDQKESFVPLFNTSRLPFDEFYSLKSSFDYSESVKIIQQDSNQLAYIKDVSISSFPDKVNAQIGPKVFAGFVDLNLELVRYPRP